jgi:hypothetical protein
MVQIGSQITGVHSIEHIGRKSLSLNLTEHIRRRFPVNFE